MKIPLDHLDHLLAIQNIRTARRMRRVARQLVRAHQPSAAYVLRADADLYALRARRIWNHIEWLEI